MGPDGAAMTGLAAGHSHSSVRRAIDVLQNRASLVATEFSLLGLGSGLLMATAAAGMAQGSTTIPIGRQSVAVAGGLISSGLVGLLIGHGFDIGGCRTASRGMAAYFWPLTVLAGLAAACAWTSFALPWPSDGDGGPLPAGMIVVTAASVVLCIPLLAGLGLRALAAPSVPPPAPLVQLLQATSHTMTGSAALLLVLCSLNEQLTISGRHYIAAAVCTLAAHSLIWAGLLLRESRQMVRLLNESGTRLPGLVRCHRIASAATVGGLMLPGLLIFRSLMTGKEYGLFIGAALLVASSHAMRFAWVLTSFRRVPKGGHAPQRRWILF